MPWYPKARHHNVRRDQNRRITPVRINHHTAVTNAQHLDRQAGDLKQAYPHFMIGRDGQVVQYQDTSLMARADLDGNPDTISIETWDGYPGGAPGYWKHNSDVPPWTDAQVRALIDLDAWILEQHPSIPRRLARDSRPGPSSHGLSWHRLGCDGNFPAAWPYHGRLSGGVRYSRAAGKVCPGDRRITQLVEVIYPALADTYRVGGLTLTPMSEEDDDTMKHYIFSNRGSQFWLNPRDWTIRPIEARHDLGASHRAEIKTLVEATGDTIHDWRSRPNAGNNSDELGAVSNFNYAGPDHLDPRKD